MTAVFEAETKTALEELRELVAGADPVIPNNLPGDGGNPADPLAAITILTGLLHSTVDPDLTQISEAMETIKCNKRAWGNYVNKIRDDDEHHRAEAAYNLFQNQNQVEPLLRTGRARYRTLNVLKADINVRLGALQLQVAAVPPALVAGLVAVVTLQHAPIPPRRFDGVHKEYKQFLEIFDATIGNTTMEDVEKLARLLTLLDGEPKKLLSGLLVTGAKNSRLNFFVKLLEFFRP